MTAPEATREAQAADLIYGEGNALVLTNGDDEGDVYRLDRSSCWIEVDSVSVWIRRCGDSVIVELCRKGDEATSTIDTAEAQL